jgi:hypothetical protein
MKQRSFPGTVWTEEGAALTRLDLQTHTVHSHEATEDFRKIG